MMITKPVAAALDFLSSVGWSEPGDFSLEEMVFSSGAVLKSVPIEGSEGRILMNGGSAVITINSNITHLGKRNFVIAHELGHFILHKDLTSLFSDTDKTLAEWHRNGVHEHEANTFASELLMPSQIFTKKVNGRKLNLSLIEEVAAFFNVSLTAAFLRYRTLGDFPIMVIYIEDGIIKWKQASRDFPFSYLPINNKVPPWTVAGDFFNKGNIEERPEQVDAIEWFESDFNIRFKKDWKLWEQCFPVSRNSILTCLWTN